MAAPETAISNPRFRLLRGVRPWREIGVLGTMLMGLSWGIPWFRSLTQATNALSTGYAFLVFGGMMLGSYLFVRLLNAVRLRADLRRIALLLVLAASILVGLKTLLFAEETVSVADLTGRQLRSFADAYALIPDEFIITVAVLLVWRRGTQLANEKVGPRLIQSAFGIGIFMFFFYIFFNTFVTGESPGNLPVLFVFAGLMAMGAARVAVISTLRGGRDNPFDRRWMVSLLLSAAGIVGVAAWVAGELSGGKGVIGLLPRFFLGAVMGAGFLLLTPVFAVLYWLLFVSVQFIQTDNPIREEMTDIIGRLQGMAAGALAFLDPYLGPLGNFLARFGIVAKALMLWGIVVILVLLIVLAVYVQDSRRRARLRERYERLSRDGLLRALGRALQSRAQDAAQNLAGLFDRERRRRQLAAARIRRIYAELLDLCETLGAARPDSRTPREFLPRLSEIFPGHGAEVTLISAAYEKVRYGEVIENQAEVEAVEQAWMQVRTARKSGGQVPAGP